MLFFTPFNTSLDKILTSVEEGIFLRETVKRTMIFTGEVTSLGELLGELVG